jgi:Na+-driven multidrug efflux pump
MLLAVVLNALLAWCLVFGHAGFPALGLPGAGWATFAARWVHAAALAVWMLSDPRVAGRRSGNRGALPQDLSVIPAIGRLFRQGLPLAAQDVLERGARSLSGRSCSAGWAQRPWPQIR